MHILTENGMFILDSVISDLIVSIIAAVVSLVIGAAITITINTKNNLQESRRKQALEEIIKIEEVLDGLEAIIVEIECEKEMNNGIQHSHIEDLYKNLTKFIGLEMFVYNKEYGIKLLEKQDEIRKLNKNIEKMNKEKMVIQIFNEDKNGILEKISENLIDISGHTKYLKWTLVGIKSREILEFEKYIKN